MSFLMSLSRRSQLAERLCYGRKHGLSGYVMFDYIDRRALSMPSCCHYCLGIFGHHGHCQHLPANNSRMKQHPRVCGHAFRYPFAIQWYGTTQQQSPNQLYIINWKPQLNSECTDSVHMYLCNPMYTCIFRGRERERQKDRKTDRKKGKEQKRKERKRKERKRTEKERKEERETQEFKTLAFTGFNPLFVETTLSSISMAKVLGLWIVEAGSSWVYHIPHPLKERVRTLNTINIAK